MAIKRIPTTSAQVGMYLCGIDRSWIKTPFLLHRFLIKSSSDIAKLKQAGIQEITIDTDRGRDVVSDSEPPHAPDDVSSPPNSPIPDSSRPPAVTRLDQLSPSVQGKSLSGELTTMKMVRMYMLEGIQDILHTLQKTGRLAMEQVHQITESVLAESLRHEEACIAMILTRDFSPALFDHALAVSTLAVLLGRAVGLDNTALQHLASAGLLHDAGLLNIPQILHRPLNQFSDAELVLYHKHPHRGVEMLSQQSSLSDEVDT
ncbi:MAG TPA: DUF3391 domain-containing protein, partial [Nitrospirales bacterium]|nr:DUF3391 domain-containing protein [Nitrospirales bacterium]